MKTFILLTFMCFGMLNLTSQSKKELQVSLIRAQQENEILNAQIEDLKKQLAESNRLLVESDKKYSIVASENKNLKDQVVVSKQSSTSSSYSSENRNTSNISTSDVNSTTTQCHGTTTKGTQCSRNASSGSEYCWQHEGNKTSDTKVKPSSSGGESSSGGRTIYTGPRGGRYYLSSSGKKVYVK